MKVQSDEEASRLWVERRNWTQHQIEPAKFAFQQNAAVVVRGEAEEAALQVIQSM